MLFTTSGIGGAEKRFFGLWHYLVTNKLCNCHLLINTELYNTFLQIAPIEINEYQTNITIWDSALALNKKPLQYVHNIIKNYTAPTDFIHLINTYSIYNFSNKSLFSFTESALTNVNFKGKLMYWHAFIKYDFIDVLDPIEYKNIQQKLFYKKNKISNTPGSYVDDAYKVPISFEKNQNKLVHLGRFDKAKRILRLLDAIPATEALLRQHHITDMQYVIIGYGQQQTAIEEKCKLLQEQGIHITTLSTLKPKPYLDECKITIGCQENNNYPSKALMECIASGCIPLVTDVGTTKMLAHPSFAYYLNHHFTNDSFAAQVLKIIQLSTPAFSTKAQAGFDYIWNNFSIEKMSTYYLNIYNSNQ